MKVLGDELLTGLPWANPATLPPSDRHALRRALLANTWEPALVVTGANGMPSIETAGNVVLPRAELLLSGRLPPGVEPEPGFDDVQRMLVDKPLPGTKVDVTFVRGAKGWSALPRAPWLDKALERAAKSYFDVPNVMAVGEGGSIPFIGALAEILPTAQFLVTGVLGPGSNAHGPNESLNLRYLYKVNGLVVEALAAHGQHRLAGD